MTFRAELLSSGKFTSKNGEKEIENDPLVELLENPNEYQTGEELLKCWSYYFDAHGWVYVYPSSNSVGFENQLKSSTIIKSKLYVLDPDLIKFTHTNISNRILSLFGVDNPVKFDYEPLGLVGIKYSEIVPYFDIRQNSEKPYTGVSRLLALGQQIQNYFIAMQGKEHLLKSVGGQLIVLDGKTDDFGLDVSVPDKFDDSLDENGNTKTVSHKENLENQLNRTGLGGAYKTISFMNLNLKKINLSDGLDKIKFDAYALEDARSIYNKFNIPQEFQNLTTKTSATADDKTSALMWYIQNSTEPTGNQLPAKLAKFYNHQNTVTLDFDHLPVFQENEETRVDVNVKVVDMYLRLFEAGLIKDVELKLILEDYGITSGKNNK